MNGIARRALAASIWLTLSTMVTAGIGMWIPTLIGRNIEEMREMGFHLTAQDIYDANHSSLKDAVMIFDGGCTSELVSEDGLLLTNYHCGVDAIGDISALDTDYLRTGFAARSRADEIKTNVEVLKLAYLEDVTERVMACNEPVRRRLIRELEEEASVGGLYRAEVEDFYSSNQFILSVYEVFDDVRLVVAPPQQLGKFGGDTDNWMWPRQTCDFTLFRIYTGGKPYHADSHIHISTSGVKEGDFAMVMGYPGSTRQYTNSNELGIMHSRIWPVTVKMRQAQTTCLRGLMESDRQIGIDYTARYASISNGQKRAAGEIDCVSRTNLIGTLRAEEERRRQKCEEMGAILDSYAEIYGTDERPSAYMENRIFANSIYELIRGLQTYQIYRGASRANRRTNIEALFWQYDAATARAVSIAAVKAFKDVEPRWRELSPLAEEPDVEKLVDRIMGGALATPETVKRAIATNTLGDDFGVTFFRGALRLAYELIDGGTATRIRRLNKQYVNTLEWMYPDSAMSADANFTLRVSYGKIERASTGKEDVDTWYTTARQLVAKARTGEEDYALADSLVTAMDGEYGAYADADGELHTCFVASIHTTGGNSGSPTLNADGELIGINFDRSWMGIASDYRFDQECSRNISVDIRYVLFVIDKICNAKHVVEEMLQ